jgi:hypothetical protein
MSKDPPTVEMISDGEDLFVVVNGVRSRSAGALARRKPTHGFRLGRDGPCSIATTPRRSRSCLRACAFH